MPHHRVEVETWDLPVSIDAADAGLFLSYIAACNEAACHDSGTELFREDPAESLVWMLDTTYRDRRLLVARRGDEAAGYGVVSWSRSKKLVANVEVEVLPGLRGDGVEDALLDAVESVAGAQGRSVLQAEVFSRADSSGERLHAPSGHGSVPLEDETTRLMLRHGYSLGQVERVSTFDLQSPCPQADRMLADALAHAGPDYRTVWWQIPTPPEYLASYAAAISRMSTDTPAGGLVAEEDPMDADRVAHRDAMQLGMGATMAVTVVIHEPTGAVAAFNELSVGADRTLPTGNWGTLVMPEHRGHRLGTIVKCVGLSRWRELVPASPLVKTFNAEENRYMLDVNEAVGFVPVTYMGEWTKTLASS